MASGRERGGEQGLKAPVGQCVSIDLRVQMFDFGKIVEHDPNPSGKRAGVSGVAAALDFDQGLDAGSRCLTVNGMAAAVDRRGTVYAAINALVPGAAEVIALPWPRPV